MKKGLVVLCIFFVIIILIVSLNNSNDNKKVNGFIWNKNKSFLKEQTAKDVTFKNIKCYYDGKESLLSYVVQNRTDKKIYLSSCKIVIRDKNNNIISNIVIDFSREISPKEEFDFKNSVVGVDLSNAYSMELIVNNK